MENIEYKPRSRTGLLTEEEVRELLSIAVDLSRHKTIAHVAFLHITLRIARLLKKGPSPELSETFLILSAVKGLDREVYSFCIDAMLFAEGDLHAEYTTYKEIEKYLLAALKLYSSIGISKSSISLSDIK